MTESSHAGEPLGPDRPFPTARWHAAIALLPMGAARDVLFEIADGRFVTVTADTPRPPDVPVLPGVALPGLANCHSHAFHRALRGRTNSVGGGSFWTWRQGMYAVADRLDPDRYRRLATAVYAEMVLAGITTVGEFHYLHHGPGGRQYADPNAMGSALLQAAADAGIRITLLDTCYLVGGLEAAGHLPLTGTQLRFGDGDVARWATRVADLEERMITENVQLPTPAVGSRTQEMIFPFGARIGVAVHSVRAVPRSAIPDVVAAAAGRPLHVHLSEQPAENAACLARYGCSPTELLADAGALGVATTAVHATHLTAADVARLGTTGTTCCFCPTTERDLADGIGPARELRDAGSPLSLGSDQHATIDLIEEARALEMHERLRSGRRGTFGPRDLLAAATRHDSLGWPDVGRLEPGARADLVAIRTDSVRTAGADHEQILFAAAAGDVDTVIVGGRTIVREGQHRIGPVGRRLAREIDALWD